MANKKKEVYRPGPMTEGKRNIIQGLLQEYNIETAADIQEALKDLLGGTIKEMMLMIGTTIVELTSITGNIVIDSALQEAYIGNTLMNDHMSGDFPVLKPGQNAISWSGTVTRVVVKPNWRSL